MLSTISKALAAQTARHVIRGLDTTPPQSALDGLPLGPGLALGHLVGGEVVKHIFDELAARPAWFANGEAVVFWTRGGRAPRPLQEAAVELTA